MESLPAEWAPQTSFVRKAVTPLLTNCHCGGQPVPCSK